MTSFNKKHYKELVKEATEHGNTYVATMDVSGSELSFNGLSIGFKPAVSGDRCKMLKVAVSYCSAEDKYKPKHGVYQVLKKLEWDCDTISMPLMDMYTIDGPAVVATHLINLFIAQ